MFCDMVIENHMSNMMLLAFKMQLYTYGRGTRTRKRT